MISYVKNKFSVNVHLMQILDNTTLVRAMYYEGCYLCILTHKEKHFLFKMPLLFFKLFHSN